MSWIFKADAQKVKTTATNDECIIFIAATPKVKQIVLYIKIKSRIVFLDQAQNERETCYIRRIDTNTELKRLAKSISSGTH